MRRLLFTFAFVVLFAVPAAASAATFTVDMLEDIHFPTASCTESPGDCSLRDAILDADATESVDEIDFSVAGTIEVMEREVLPGLSEPVRINGASAPGYSGAPVVTLDGAKLKGTTEGAPETGLLIQGEGVAVEGLALVNFESALVVGEGSASICGDYLGTDASGTAAKPNQIGVRIAAGTEFNSVGAGCERNLISNNREYGILDEGVGTNIGNNLIGVAPDGSGALPNGTGTGPGAGILVGQFALNPFIGGGGEAGPPNTIAHNDGPGILVRTGATGVDIISNSIFENAGLGIEREPPSTAPGAPSLTGLEGLNVRGSITAAPDSDYFLQFFASRACDPSGAGEGEVYLEFDETVHTNGAGLAAFEFTLPAHSADTPVITATATPNTVAETSVFSNCVGIPPAPPSPVETLIPPAPPLIGAINGASVAVAAAAGTVKVKAPGDKAFHTLAAGEVIPVGSIIDATRGRVTLTSVDAHGNTQTADFYGGVFKVLQKPGSTLVVLKLLGSIGPCPGPSSSAAASKSGARHLWGSGKGSFRTEGKYGAATVRGTIWLTADRCTGTFFRVKRGVVSIRDIANGKGVTLRAGNTYLASPG